MKKFIFLMMSTLFLLACSTNTVDNDGVPEWVTGDAAAGETDTQFMYFVGRNAVVDASRGRPSRGAYMSAENDARRQYVEYMETLLQSKTNEALTAAGDNIEGSQTVAALKNITKTFAQKTISGLKRHDEFVEQAGENSAGLPLWNVWVRMKIEKNMVRTKFGKLNENVQKKATEGVEKAAKMADAIQNVQKKIQEDDFFEGF